MILRVLWNGHLGGTGILVARASCPLQLPSGQDAHPTYIHSKIQQRQINNTDTF
ncbi:MULTISPECIES: hypothetical protein [unclassified Moorena]|uniref:hypothetical protein n=1 Tax=unclassified Moorena TaxID=2683338 RepID=UPI0013CD6C10|nr:MULTISPECIES: hypothetical protein [unclassified Moorena]NEO22317.1 hypothetical protein [Moorena sp. SIO4A5]NEP21663.1 hypothetical protein [Moorena sp. SIO3I6]NEQ62038.1 hypothetical protein [Moorena sp. SIO4A1]